MHSAFSSEHMPSPGGDRCLCPLHSRQTNTHCKSKKCRTAHLMQGFSHHAALQSVALYPTSSVHSLPFGNKITCVTTASDKKKALADCTGCNKSVASRFVGSRAKNHTFSFLPQGAALHPCTNPQLSPVPTPPTHKLPGSIEQAEDTLSSLPGSNASHGDQQMPSSPHYLVNLANSWI